MNDLTLSKLQGNTRRWTVAAFGVEIADDLVERNHRFLEEALELVQACEMTREEALMLVDFVYGRPVGDKRQEVAGATITLAALCNAQHIDIEPAVIAEIDRCWEKIDVIREKQKTKPKHE